MRISSSLFALILGLGMYFVGPIVTKFEPFKAPLAQAQTSDEGGADQGDGDDGSGGYGDGFDGSGGDGFDGGGDNGGPDNGDPGGDDFDDTIDA